MNDLSGLREDWCLFKDGDGWVVAQIRDDAYEVSEYIDRLAEAPTIAEAIVAAGVELDQREREDERRRADYKRRKAAGELMPLEQMNEYTARLWDGTVFDMISKGDTVIIPHLSSYEAVRVEKEPDER
jgi:hypothetical protein